MNFNNPQEENAYKLVERIKSKNITIKDKALLAWLRDGHNIAREYISGYLLEAMKEASYMKPVIMENNIVSLTHTAELWGVATSALSAEYKKQGYNIKYDRNRKYCKDRVITYIEVK